MNEITNKIKALIESEQEELKDLEEFKNKTKTKLDSDESFSLSTYRMLVRMLAETALKIDLHKAFIKKLLDILPKEFSRGLIMEKERYILIYNEDELGYSIIDTEEQFSDDIHSWVLLCDLLNQQDARIKELEDENGYIIFADGYDDNGNEVNKQVYTTYKSKCDELIKEKQQLKEENQQLINQYDLLNKKYCEEMDKNIALIEQLKQSQNQKAIECLEKVKNDILNITDKFGEIKTLQNGYSTYYVDRPTIIDYIDNQIKELEVQV